MFKFIESDLNNAEKYIVNLASNNNNTLPNLAVVYGLKARLYMWNEDYAQAKDYARKAIDTYGKAPILRKKLLTLRKVSMIFLNGCGVLSTHQKMVQ